MHFHNQTVAECLQGFAKEDPLSDPTMKETPPPPPMLISLLHGMPHLHGTPYLHGILHLILHGGMATVHEVGVVVMLPLLKMDGISPVLLMSQVW